MPLIRDYVAALAKIIHIVSTASYGVVKARTRLISTDAKLAISGGEGIAGGHRAGRH